MQGKIDKVSLGFSEGYFFPEYPENVCPIFKGIFDTCYGALDDQGEFNSKNVLTCGVGKKVRDILDRRRFRNQENPKRYAEKNKFR